MRKLLVVLSLLIPSNVLAQEVVEPPKPEVVFEPTAHGLPTETQLAPIAAKRLGIPPITGDTIERVLWDRTRCDVVWTEKNLAIEVDWAKSGKWAEAVGQSIYYAKLLHMEPGIILLTTGKSDDPYVYRCQTDCAVVGIKLWVMDANDLAKEFRSPPSD